MARSLVVTPVLQAVLRQLLDEGRAVPRCHYDIVVATGLASGTVHAVLKRLAARPVSQPGIAGGPPPVP